MSRIPFATQQPDARVVSLLFSLQRIVLGAIAAIAALTLFAWVLPPLGHMLPAVWMLINPNTLGCALLGALSMSLSQPTRSARSMALSRVFAVMVTVVAAVCLIDNLYGHHAAAQAMASTQGFLPPASRMSSSLALAFLLIGLVLCCLRKVKGALAVVADLLTVAASMLMLVLTSGYLFDSGRGFTGAQHRVAPEELVILLCLTFAVFSRRAEYGAFSILLETGIGGETARLAAPMAIGLPLVMGLVEIGGVSTGLVAPAYATAVVTSVMSLVAFCLVLVLARRASGMEHEISELSLRDPLTGLYNRRSFLLLADQAMRQTRRSGDPFSLLLIDVDGLREINDSLGHDAGSELLQRMASLLIQNFRESDVTARLTGDEFVVAGSASAPEIAVATYRLLQMANVSNQRMEGRPALSFSFGHVSCDHSVPFTIESLIEKANAIVCEGKRSKRGHGLRAVPTLVRSLHPVLHKHS